MLKKFAIAGVFALALVAGIAAPASATDTGGDGNPLNCTNNINVGPASPVVASDGRVVGWSQMRWSYSCQANWIKAWTANGQAAELDSTIFVYGPPTPDRPYATSDDYAASHFTLYLVVPPSQEMCGSTQIWDTVTENWAFSGVTCYS